MAATRRKKKDRTRRRLRAFPWVAAGLGALAAPGAHAQSTLDFRYLFYKESGGRTEVSNPTVFLHQDFGEAGGQLSLLLGYDTISGASPTGAYPTADTVTSASGATSSANIPLAQYQDQRKSGTLSYARKFGSHLPSVDLSYSKENDYLSKTWGASDAWTMAHGRGTLHFGYSASRDTVSPTTSTADYPKSTDGYSAGWTWIAGERDLFDVSATVMNLSGYLDDPYKIVPVGTGTMPDHRPDSRSRRAVVGKYGHYYTSRAALRTSYRYYWDDWGIKAHTLDIDFDQHVGARWLVSPRLRLYTQTAASFYASSLPSPETYMSADYRLSSFNSVLGGLTLSYELRSGLTVSAGATAQAQSGRDRIVPLPAPAIAALREDGDDGEEGSGGGTVSAADLTTFTFTVGLSWRY